MASTTSYSDLLNRIPQSDTIEQALIVDITNKCNAEQPDGASLLARAIKDRFESSDTQIRSNILTLLDYLIVECGPNLWDALVQCGFFSSLASIRGEQINLLISERLSRWRIQMGAKYEAIIDEALLNTARNGDQVTRRVIGGVGKFRRKPIKPLAPFLTIAYLRAHRVLETATRCRNFHMQTVHIARQALHLVILLNDHLDEEELSDEDEDERLYLEDELQQLEVAIAGWGTKSVNLADYSTQISDIQKQYRQFFRSRFYYDDARDPQKDKLYKKLLTYDKKTIEMRELKKEYGNVVMDDQDARGTQSVPGGAFIESVNSSPAMAVDVPLNQVSVSLSPDSSVPEGVTAAPSDGGTAAPLVDPASSSSTGDDLERARQYRTQQKADGPVSQTFKCPVPGCDKSFDKQYLLRHHIREHDDRPYRCPMRDCDRRFATPTEQRVHEALHRIKNMGIIPNMPAFSPPIAAPPATATQQTTSAQAQVTEPVEEVKSDPKPEDVKSDSGQPDEGLPADEDGKGKQAVREEGSDTKGKGKESDGDEEGIQTAISLSMSEQERVDTEEEMVRQAVSDSLREPRDENQGTSGAN